MFCWLLFIDTKYLKHNGFSKRTPVSIKLSLNKPSWHYRNILWTIYFAQYICNYLGRVKLVTIYFRTPHLYLCYNSFSNKLNLIWTYNILLMFAAKVFFLVLTDVHTWVAKTFFLVLTDVHTWAAKTFLCWLTCTHGPQKHSCVDWRIHMSRKSIFSRVDWRIHMTYTHDVYTWVDRKSKLLNYFLKLKTKGKKKPFSRDFRVRRNRSEVFLKIAVPSKLTKSLKNICEKAFVF